MASPLGEKKKILTKNARSAWGGSPWKARRQPTSPWLRSYSCTRITTSGRRGSMIPSSKHPSSSKRRHLCDLRAKNEDLHSLGLSVEAAKSWTYAHVMPYQALDIKISGVSPLQSCLLSCGDYHCGHGDRSWSLLPALKWCICR